MLFLFGSALANYVISIALNSFICDSSSGELFNFSGETCYNNLHYIYMVLSLLILLIYWPISLITFPFSTAIDRSL